MSAPGPDLQPTIEIRSAWSRYFRWAATSTGWLLVIGIAGLLTNRYLSVTRPIPILLAGLTPFLLIPVFLGGITSAISRSRVLRIVTAVLAGVYLVTVAPHDAVFGCRPTQDDESITVVASNVLGDGATPDDVAAFLLETDADVVALSETARWFLDNLGPLLDEHYPYQSHESVGYNNGSAIFSRWPLSNVENFPLPDVPTKSADVTSPYGTFQVVAVHTQAPSNSYTAMEWGSQFEDLTTLAQGSPTVLAGDFNATEDHKLFRQLLDEGWSDVHDDKGCGLDNTWPTARPQQSTQRLIPFMRLDHVLVTDHFDTLAVETHELPGSDHAAVETQIRLNTDRP